MNFSNTAPAFAHNVTSNATNGDGDDAIGSTSNSPSNDKINNAITGITTMVEVSSDKSLTNLSSTAVAKIPQNLLLDESTINYNF